MDNGTKNVITNSEIVILIISSMLGVGLFSLPNDVVKIAHQDGWVSCIIGALYPLYIVFMASYMCRKHPTKNIYKLSKMCFGKILGTILNTIFTLVILIFATNVASGISNIIRVFVTPFLSNSKFLIVFFLIPAFMAYEGIKTLGRSSELIFYLTLGLFFIPLIALQQSLFTNVMPVFGSGIINIVKASKQTAFAYSGIEIIFVIYPYLQDKEKFKRNGIIGVLITMIIYTLFVFITICYLGIDNIPKFLWSTLITTEAIKIPIINNFKFIFIVLWITIMFRTLGIYYYTFTESLTEFTQKIKRQDIVLIVFPIFFYISTRYVNPIIRKAFMDETFYFFILFNIVYTSSIGLILAIKR